MKAAQSSGTISQSGITAIEIRNWGEGGIQFIFPLDGRFHPNMFEGKPALVGGVREEGGEFAQWRIRDEVSEKERQIIQIAGMLKQLIRNSNVDIENIEQGSNYVGASIFSLGLRTRIIRVKI